MRLLIIFSLQLIPSLEFRLCRHCNIRPGTALTLPSLGFARTMWLPRIPPTHGHSSITGHSPCDGFSTYLWGGGDRSPSLWYVSRSFSFEARSDVTLSFTDTADCSFFLGSRDGAWAMHSRSLRDACFIPLYRHRSHSLY